MSAHAAAPSSRLRQSAVVGSFDQARQGSLASARTGSLDRRQVSERKRVSAPSLGSSYGDKDDDDDDANSVSRMLGHSAWSTQPRAGRHEVNLLDVYTERASSVPRDEDRSMARLYAGMSQSADREKEVLKARVAQVEAKLAEQALEIKVIRLSLGTHGILPAPAYGQQSMPLDVQIEPAPIKKRSCRCSTVVAGICFLVAIPVLLYCYAPVVSIRDLLRGHE